MDVNQKMSYLQKNSFILDAVTVLPSVLLDCTAKFAAAGLPCGLHINSNFLTAVCIIVIKMYNVQLQIPFIRCLKLSLFL